MFKRLEDLRLVLLLCYLPPTANTKQGWNAPICLIAPLVGCQQLGNWCSGRRVSEDAQCLQQAGGPLVCPFSTIAAHT